MRFQKPTKLELFLDGFHDFCYALDCYNAGDYREFWEALSSGWYDEYIYPYDDAFYIHKPSPERKLRLAEKPPTTYLSPENFDALVEKLNQPPDPESVKRLREILNKPAPWDTNNE